MIRFLLSSILFASIYLWAGMSHALSEIEERHLDQKLINIYDRFEEQGLDTQIRVFGGLY